MRSDDTTAHNGPSAPFPAHVISNHGPLLRYPLLAPNKFGLRFSKETMCRFSKLDDRIGKIGYECELGRKPVSGRRAKLNGFCRDLCANLFNYIDERRDAGTLGAIETECRRVDIPANLSGRDRQCRLPQIRILKTCHFDNRTTFDYRAASVFRQLSVANIEIDDRLVRSSSEGKCRRKVIEKKKLIK